MAHSLSRLWLQSNCKAEAPCAGRVPRPWEDPADGRVLTSRSAPEARQITQPQTEWRWSQGHGSLKLRAEIPDEAARVRLSGVVERKPVVSAAPRMSQTLDQYRTKEQPVTAHVVALTVPAWGTADAPFRDVPPWLGGRAQHIGESA